MLKAAGATGRHSRAGAGNAGEAAPGTQRSPPAQQVAVVSSHRKPRAVSMGSLALLGPNWHLHFQIL